MTASQRSHNGLRALALWTLLCPCPRLVLCARKPLSSGLSTASLEKASGIKDWKGRLYLGSEAARQALPWYTRLFRIERRFINARFPIPRKSVFTRTTSRTERWAERKAGIQDDCIIGPSVKGSFWQGERQSMLISRGPCE